MFPRGIFFDVDGVLIDSVSIKGQCFVKVFADHPEKAEQVRAWHEKYGGVNRVDKIRSISLEVLGIQETNEQIARRVLHYEWLVMKQVTDAPDICGARATLENLRNKELLFAASATPDGELREILHSRGIDHYFEEIFGWPITKTEALSSTLTKFALHPLNCVLIGDSRQDKEAATATGVKFILVTGEISHRVCEADAYVKDLTNLSCVIEHVLGTE